MRDQADSVGAFGARLACKADAVGTINAAPQFYSGKPARDCIY